MGCGCTIEACMGFGLARDILACQNGTRTTMPRELCGRCVERASQNRQWFAALIEQDLHTLLANYDKGGRS